MDGQTVIKQIATVYPSGFRVGITRNNNMVIDFIDSTARPGQVIGSYFLELQAAKDMLAMIKESIESIEKKS
jgi:hypothetical protein